MPSHDGPVHVAIVKRPYKGKEYKCALLRRTYREDGKVKHETLGNISHLPDPLIDIIRRYLKGETFVGAGEDFQLEASLPHGHVLAALETMRRSGLSQAIYSRRSRQLSLIEAMVVHRIIEPGSKLACAQSLSKDTASNTLGELLDLEAVNEDELYAAMDWLAGRQSRIEDVLAKKHLTDGSLVLYDVTSAYFEGRHCPLARHGHSRDHRPDRPQIVIGLLCNAEGCPVAVEVFEGNTGDPSTVAHQVNKLLERFKLKNIVMVGDRGMLTEARISKDLRPNDIHWVTALRAPAIQRLMLDKTLQLSFFDETNLVELSHPDFPGERLLACRNPYLEAERKRKREALLASTEKALQKVADATRRPRNPLRGAEAISLRVGKVIGRYKMAKHFLCHIDDSSFTFTRDQASIDREAASDGIYVVRTDVSEVDMSSRQAVLTYKSLSRVERAFRGLKRSELQFRPIFHRVPDRVRAHVFICMLAYYVQWHMTQALAPLLFQDDHKAEAAAARICVVASSERSQDALDKAMTKHTRDGEPVQSFRRMLRTLAALTRNTVSFSGGRFKRASTPTPLQSRAFELLGVHSIM